MATSIKDVAREANVSIATVSRVLNNVDVVNEDTKKKVLEAIKKLDYRPNIVARSLKTQKTRTIGIIIPDISNPIYPEVVRGAEDVSNIYNYNIMLCNTDLEPDKELEYLRVLGEKMVDGVIYISNSLEERTIKTIKDTNMPLVLIETNGRETEFPSVIIDNKSAAIDAVNYLLKKGNKRIAYIGISDDVINASAIRHEGYIEGLSQNNIPYDKDITFFCKYSLKAEDGYEAMNNILEKTTDIDAVFCVNDEIAMGAINALRDKGIKVPEDVDVMGFNDTHGAEFFYPRLTTIAQPLYDMGSVATRMLIKKINNEPLDKELFVLPYELIERDSCK
ncbi:LacI family transcriptional regulator [Clostridium botulinum C]|nr:MULTISPECIES: LacI family DNA-binding transcriptional regulator [Clostridium]EES92244.1 catabolite control protein A [Clostridium botulinum D str. 1873]KEI08374.1 catabolite control protein A [Clostridium sp. K25]KEI13228.1 catabolite control protein A [Clostridium novyi B str. NCTC 9691]KEI16807.1 catabolite control protein A [Clostridium haemolyticum NCTC 9693]KEI17118.1 catabolite control protein A [Clostridium novyi B str. ATCC 27606]